MFKHAPALCSFLVLMESAILCAAESGGVCALQTRKTKGILEDLFFEDVVYEDGSISNADYDRSSIDTEEAVQAACTGDDNCKGYWQRTSGEFYILRSGSRTWAKGKPNGSVASVKVKKSSQAPVPAPTDADAYEEGTVTDADYDRNWLNSEDEAVAACSDDDGCKGYWLRTSGEYFILNRRGSGTFSAGVPHETVAKVWVRKAASGPAPGPAPVSPPAPPAPVPPPPPAPAVDDTYEEGGTVTNADYDRDWFNSEEEIRAACSNDDGCKGYWLRSSGEYFILNRPGSGTFSAGVPHETVVKVWAKKGTSGPSPPPGPSPQPPAPPAPQPDPDQGPTPAPMPESRDTETVAPEEWDYFLAFQRSRKAGFSCPCGDGWHECNDPTAGESGLNHWSPNSEKATFDCTLWVAAYRHAEDQAIQGYFSHTGKDGRSERERAEDVGAVSRGEHQAGHHSTGAGALGGLQTSPGHCNSMFQPKYRGIAVGHGARRDDPRGDGDIWTIMYNFGPPDDLKDSVSCIPAGYTGTGDRT